MSFGSGTGDAVGQLILCIIVAVMFWPSLDPAYWRQYPDQLSMAIALVLEVAAIAGAVRALIVILT